jgi:hypothetical protein
MSTPEPIYFFEGSAVATHPEWSGSVVATLAELFCSLIGPRYTQLTPAAKTTARHTWLAFRTQIIQHSFYTKAVHDGFDFDSMTSAEMDATRGDKLTPPRIAAWPHTAIPLLILRARGRDSSWVKPTGEAVLVVSAKTETETLESMVALGMLTKAECLTDPSQMQDPHLGRM